MSCYRFLFLSGIFSAIISLRVFAAEWVQRDTFLECVLDPATMPSNMTSDRTGHILYGPYLPLPPNTKGKIEAIFYIGPMLVRSHQILPAGISFSFGGGRQQSPPPRPAPVPILRFELSQYNAGGSPNLAEFTLYSDTIGNTLAHGGLAGMIQYTPPPIILEKREVQSHAGTIETRISSFIPWFPEGPWPRDGQWPHRVAFAPIVQFSVKKIVLRYFEDD